MLGGEIMRITKGELIAIHNLFVKIFRGVITVWDFCCWYPPIPAYRDGEHLKNATFKGVPELVTITTLVSSPQLKSILQKCVDDCIAARTFVHLSQNSYEERKQFRIIYEAFLIVAQYLDEVLQEDKPQWIKAGKIFGIESLCEKLPDRDAEYLVIPTIMKEGKEIISYYEMFMEVKREYSN